MKYLIINVLLFVSLFSPTIKSQNLVTNGSFETINNCPGGYNNISTLTSEWCSIGGEIFSICATNLVSLVPNPHINGLTNIYQLPHSGNNYIGLAIFGKDNSTLQYRETVVQKLTNELGINKHYCITFYANNSFVYGSTSVDRMGAYLSADSLVPCTVADSVFQVPLINIPSINAVPVIESPSGVLLDDTLNWTKVSGSYIADGTEQFVTIGCLRPDSIMQTFPIYNDTTGLYTYYFIDDISIVEVLNKIEAGADTVTCINDSVQIGLPPIDGVEYNWQPHTGLSNPYISNPKTMLNQTTTYILTTLQCEVTLYDTLTVTVFQNPCSVSVRDVELNKEVKIFPNPATNLLNISSPQPIQKIEIYNAQGQVVQTIQCNSIVNYQLIIVNYNNGIYFYTLTFANKSSARGKFMIQK